jgi:transcriptional regulator with XRE-family HTH domain
MTAITSDQARQIGDRIAGVRLARRDQMTRHELARAADVPPATIRGAEGGTLVPTDSALERIARALGVTFEWIKNGGAS